MHHPTDRITHTTAFVIPVVEHWLEREIAQWVHHHQGSIRRSITPWANALTTELHLAHERTGNAYVRYWNITFIYNHQRCSFSHQRNAPIWDRFSTYGRPIFFFLPVTIKCPCFKEHLRLSCHNYTNHSLFRAHIGTLGKQLNTL